MFKPELTLISGGKDDPLDMAESFESQVAENSVIEEEHVFSRGEVLGIIEQAAQKESINRSELEIFRETNDKV